MEKPLPYDVRSIANFVIDVAASRQRHVTNLSLNKIVYFLHAAHLLKYGTALVSAKIEAWDHGPVFRELYHQFKDKGKEPINRKAHRLDVRTGEMVVVKADLDSETSSFLEAECVPLLQISPGKLVDMSHITDGPWYKARYADGQVNPGVEITDELIRACQAQGVRH